MDEDRPTKYYLMNKNSKIISDESLGDSIKDYERITTKVNGQLESKFSAVTFYSGVR
ncbi:MAG: hypothetical protein U5J63_04550 [Fodinibius sp.]|nr:hypothetical protein [Fodinibius sp.]